MHRRLPTIEACSIRLGEREVGFTLRRSPRRRTVALLVDDRGLTVSAPTGVPFSRVEGFLLQKAQWVLTKLDAFARGYGLPMAWEHGTLLPYLGNSLRLCLSIGTGTPEMDGTGDCLLVPCREPQDRAEVEKKVVAWYRARALAHFRSRVDELAAVMAVTVRALKLSNAKGRWGSCNGKGEIRLNWRLIKAPPVLIDYVIVHELAHRVEMNHSPAFWQVVEAVLPDYRQQRRALRSESVYYGRF